MKTFASRLGQFYLFAFIAMSAILFLANARDHPNLGVGGVVLESVAHGAIWPVTLIDWISAHS